MFKKYGINQSCSIYHLTLVCLWAELLKVYSDIFEMRMTSFYANVLLSGMSLYG